MADVAVITAYRDSILRYVTHMIRDAPAAEDIAQEVWLRASNSIHTVRDDDAIAAWLYRIATHAALDHLRSRKRQFARDPATEVDEAEVDDDQSTSLADLLERAEMSACVQRFVQQLPDDYRSVLFLTEFEGLSGTEVAETMGITLSTAKIRLHRARQQLKNALSRGCCFNRDERGVLVCEPKATEE